MTTSKTKTAQKIAFLDRDGTLIFEPQDTYQIDSLEKLKILDGVIDGLQKLKEKGYSLIMISNQDGLGTSSFPYPDFEKPHQKMLQIFAKNNIKFDQIFICPHFPKDNCACRKPKTGLVQNFLKNLELDKTASFVCGDRSSDKEFAQNLNLNFVKIKTNGNFLKAVESFGNLKKNKSNYLLSKIKD
ncbi:MAG: histidinol-phosphatase [Candidatus Moranbacteria bacterium]|nr:histidinol-phosphatase [Candidatus Moranbacteria bacterium]